MLDKKLYLYPALVFRTIPKSRKMNFYVYTDARTDNQEENESIKNYIIFFTSLQPSCLNIGNKSKVANKIFTYYIRFLEDVVLGFEVLKWNYCERVHASFHPEENCEIFSTVQLPWICILFFNFPSLLFTKRLV